MPCGCCARESSGAKLIIRAAKRRLTSTRPGHPDCQFSCVSRGGCEDCRTLPEVRDVDGAGTTGRPSTAASMCRSETPKGAQMRDDPKGPEFQSYRFDRKRVNASSDASDTWCSMPSASVSATSDLTPTAISNLTIRRCRARTWVASSKPASVRKIPR
jgi:hypothetical protein